MGTERYASEDISIAGVTIPGGSLVGVVLASANRDGNQFSSADTLDIQREPNKHLAVRGWNPLLHRCTFGKNGRSNRHQYTLANDSTFSIGHSTGIASVATWTCHPWPCGITHHDHMMKHRYMATALSEKPNCNYAACLMTFPLSNRMT